MAEFLTEAPAYDYLLDMRPNCIVIPELEESMAAFIRIAFFFSVTLNAFSPAAFSYEESEANGKKTTKNSGLFSTDAPADETTLYFDEDSKEEKEFDERASEPSKSSPQKSQSISRSQESIGVSASLGFGAGSFFSRASVSLPLYPYLYTDVSGFYLSDQKSDSQARAYGGEIDLVARLANRTMFTPFVGAGPGFEHWRKVQDHEVYYDGDSTTASYFFGVLIGFTKNFGLSVSRRIKYYINNSPVYYEDGEVQRGPKSVASVDVAFQVMF